MADLVEVISQGIPFNAWLGAEVCKELGGQCITEPTIIDLKPVMSFDLVLLIEDKPITYVEVKRTLRRRLKTWVVEEVLSFLGKALRILGSFGMLTRNVQRIALVLVVLTHETSPRDIAKFCREKTEELSRGLESTLVSNCLMGRVLQRG